MAVNPGILQSNGSAVVVEPGYVCKLCGQAESHFITACPNNHLRTELLSKAESEGKVLSKNQQRRVLKRQQFKLVQARNKADKKRTKETANTVTQDEGSSSEPQIQLTDELPAPKRVRTTDPPKKLRRKAIAEASMQGIRIVIDLSYGSHMNLGEIKSLKTQIKASYTETRRIAQPSRLMLTSLSGDMLEHMQTIGGFDKWYIDRYDKHFTEALPISEIICLSPDSPNVLDQVTKEFIYVIGGLVDRDPLLGLSLGRAQTQNLRTARLPLAEYIKIGRSDRLPVNQVVSIISEVACTGNWLAAFLRCIPNCCSLPKPSIES